MEGSIPPRIASLNGAICYNVLQIFLEGNVCCLWYILSNIIGFYCFSLCFYVVQQALLGCKRAVGLLNVFCNMLRLQLLLRFSLHIYQLSDGKLLTGAIVAAIDISLYRLSFSCIRIVFGLHASLSVCLYITILPNYMLNDTLKRQENQSQILEKGSMSSDNMRGIKSLTSHPPVKIIRTGPIC